MESKKESERESEIKDKNQAKGEKQYNRLRERSQVFYA